MMFGSSAQFMYDVPFSSDEEEEDGPYYYDGEEEDRELPTHPAGPEALPTREGKGKEKDVEGDHHYVDQEQLDELLARRLQYGDDPPPEHLGAPITEKVALTDYLAPKTRPSQEKKSKVGGAKKKDHAEKRKREAAALQAKFGDLFEVSSSGAPTTKPASKGGRRSRSHSKNTATSGGKQSAATDGSAIAEEWTLRLLAGDELLELGFKLPHAYPSVPASVSARLSLVSLSGGVSCKKTQKSAQQDEKGKEKVDSVVDAASAEDDEAHAFAEDEAKQAWDSTQRREKIDRSLYDSSVVNLLQEQANKGAKVPALVELARQWLDLYITCQAELERQRKARAQREAEAAAPRTALADLRKPAPELNNFQSWLLRLGLKKQVKPDYLEEVDTEEIFNRKLAERKRFMQRRKVESLWTLCIAAIGDSLLRYESLEGFPLQLRMEVLAYLVSELRLLYKEHLEVLLDTEFVALDFSGLARNGAENKLKDAHLKIVGEKCPRLREINLTGAVKLKPSGLSDGLSKCHMLSRLVVDDCAKVDDDAMTAVIEGCPLLTFFSARRCPLITHITLYLLGRRCSDLSSVIVAGCVKIALEGVINLTRMSKRLQVLDASEVGNEYTSASKYYVEPNRLSNQWLNSVTFDRCKRITRGFLRELFGPLPGQVCPNLATVSLRDCPLITNGTLEEVILPACPNLQALHYAGSKKATGISAVNLNGLSFLEGCKYAFPVRGAKLPVRLQMARKDLAQNASVAGVVKTPITQAAMRRLVPDPTAFLRSARQFDTNVLARQAMRNINSLTLAACGFADQYNLLDFIISLPALRYLDVTNTNVRFKQLLFSCYYFLPQLETLICKRNEDLVPTRFTPMRSALSLFDKEEELAEPDTSDRFELREKHVKAKLLLDMEKEQHLVKQQGEQADSAIKRKLWIVQHIEGDDKRYAPRLHTLDVSGHSFGGSFEFADLISNRCPELRTLSLSNVRGLGDRSLLQLLDQCVHMQTLNLHGHTDHTVTCLRQKKPSLEICRRESW